jgi:hypothetical protein
MGNTLTLRFLALVEMRQYTVEPSHGVPPFSVALANTTLEGKDSCGYPSAKTVRSIDQETDMMQIPRVLLERFTEALCYAA